MLLLLGGMSESDSDYCDTCSHSVTYPSVCTYVVCHSLAPTKAVGRNEMQVAPSNIALDRVPAPLGKGRFEDRNRSLQHVIFIFSQGSHEPGKPGILRISLNMENSRNSVQPLGKNCNEQSIFSVSFIYLCKTAVDWVNRIIRKRDKVRVRW